MAIVQQRVAVNGEQGAMEPPGGVPIMGKVGWQLGGGHGGHEGTKVAKQKRQGRHEG